MTGVNEVAVWFFVRLIVAITAVAVGRFTILSVKLLTLPA